MYTMTDYVMPLRIFICEQIIGSDPFEPYMCCRMVQRGLQVFAALSIVAGVWMFCFYYFDFDMRAKTPAHTADGPNIDAFLHYFLLIATCVIAPIVTVSLFAAAELLRGLIDFLVRATRPQRRSLS